MDDSIPEKASRFYHEEHEGHEGTQAGSALFKIFMLFMSFMVSSLSQPPVSSMRRASVHAIQDPLRQCHRPAAR
jgi:hypothetical protein